MSDVPCSQCLAPQITPDQNDPVILQKYFFNKNVLKAVKMCECEGIFQNSVGVTYLELVEVWLSCTLTATFGPPDQNDPVIPRKYFFLNDVFKAMKMCKCEVIFQN